MCVVPSGAVASSGAHSPLIGMFVARMETVFFSVPIRVRLWALIV